MSNQWLKVRKTYIKNIFKTFANENITSQIIFKDKKVVEL